MDHLIGSQFKGYELLELIGTGGFGAVYRAKQATVGREVAVKVILPEFTNAPAFVRRFEAEAQLVARLEHPYIVPLYDYWRDPNGAYLVMRYLRGGNLVRLIKEDGPLSLERTGRMLSQIGTALAVAHAGGVIHRDLKPDNILLDEQGNHYLSDFGIAKDISKDTNLTATGTIIGSPAYLSPEQITGEDLTALSDVYSLGILLHFALTGEHPFPGKTPTAMLVHHMQDNMPPLRMLREDIPEPLEDVLQRATAKDPASRYTSVLELATAFNAAMRESASTSELFRLDETDAELFKVDTSHLKNPYKGLQAFDEADSDDFFGREELTERLLNKLHPSEDEVYSGDNLMVVVGPSGSGKSSVVKAGLIPALRRGGIPGSEDWFYVEMVPGMHPIEELEAALLRIAINPPESLMNQLQQDERGLLRAIKRVLPDDHTRLVLFIDQFEEVFTLTENEAARNHFLQSLLAAVTEPRSRLTLILTLRADFYDRPLSYYELGELVRQYTEVVLPLGPQELESAIVKPSQRVGVMLEPGLASAIVDDVREQPGALPLLQYALTQLFDKRDGNRLTLKAYDELGGAMGALARRAEEIYQNLGVSAQAASRQLFLRLVTLGEGTEDTRRRILRGELNALDQANVIDDVIEIFGKARLLTFDNDPQTREPTIEVAHEALIREWGRLRDWLDAARDTLRTQRRLFIATNEWLASGKDRSFLASGTRLDQFEGLVDSDLVAMNQTETEYLTESLNQRQAAIEAEAEQHAREQALEARARRRMQALVVVSMLAAIIASVLAVSAFRAQQQAVVAQGAAEIAALEANESAIDAQAAALSASAINLLSNYRPNLALNLALEAADTRPQNTAVQRALAQAAYAPGVVTQINPYTTASLLSVSFNGPGDKIVAGSSEGNVLVFDPFDITVLQDIRAHTGPNDDGETVGLPVYAVAYSPVADVIASGDETGIIRLWDAASGEMLFELSAHTNQVTALVFSPDGSRLLSGGFDKQMLLWDVASGEQLLSYEGHLGGIFSVDFSADGTRVVSSTGDDRDNPDILDRAVRVFDADTGELLREIRAEGSGWFRAVAIHPEGTAVAAASYDPNEFGGTIRVWDVNTSRRITRLTGHTDVITTLDFGPTGRTLISGGWDRTVRRWDVITGAEIQRFDTHADRILDVAYSPDGRYALTTAGRTSGVAPDNRAFLFALNNDSLIETLTGHENWVWSARYSPDGAWIATGSGDLNIEDGDNSVRLWDAETGEPGAVLLAHTDAVKGVSFNGDASRLASASEDGTVIVWDLATNSQVLTLTGHGEGADNPETADDVNDVVFSPDDSLLATAGRDGTVRLWDAETGDMLTVIEAHDGRANRVVFSPDGELLISGGTDSMVKVWNTRSGENVYELTGLSGWVNVVNISPDGQFVVAGADNDVVMWDVNTGEVVQRFVGHQGFVYGADLSPDGNYLVSGASDTTVRLWEVATAEEIRRFTGHTNWILEAKFSPDGSRVVTAAEDNTARVWRIARSTGELIGWIEANRYLPQLTCGEREQYNVMPLCGSDEADAAVDRGREGRSAAID